MGSPEHPGGELPGITDSLLLAFGEQPVRRRCESDPPPVDTTADPAEPPEQAPRRRFARE
jgi:hypothetical protein